MLLRIYKTCDCAEKFVQGTEVKPPSYLAVQKFMYFYVHIVCPCLSVRYADNGPQQKKNLELLWSVWKFQLPWTLCNNIFKFRVYETEKFQKAVQDRNPSLWIMV